MDLVTGGTGLVGSHVLLELLSRGRSVRAIHRRGSGLGLVRRVFRYYHNDGDTLFDRIEWVQCDVLDVQGIEEAAQGIDNVYHCAAMVSFDPRDTAMLFSVNINGTANVVNAALTNGVKTLVHVSSTGATGRSANGRPVDETMPFVQDHRTSPYAISKYNSELEVQRGVAEGLRALIVNPSVILGPGDDRRGSLSMIGRLRKGTRFFPTGSVGVVDVRDVAWAMVELVGRGADGERYILSGPTIHYRDLFAGISTAMGQHAPSRPVPAWALQMAWRLDRVRHLFGGGRALITQHTVRSALSHRSYSSAKVRALLGMEFRSPQEAIQNACAFHRGS